MDENINELIEKLVADSGKGKEEIEKLIREKMDKYSGLLTETAAVYMVAKEIGINLELAEKTEKPTKIDELKNGADNVVIEGIVKHIYSPKRFEKGEKKGVLCNVLLADNSGEIRLTLWHKDVKNLYEERIERGETVLLKGVYVTEYNEKLQLNLGRGGEIIFGHKAKELPEINKDSVKISKFEDGMNNIDVYGRIVRIYNEKSFDTGERYGNLIGFELIDETGKCRCTAWNEMSNEVKKFSSGDLVKIEGAYTKKGLNEEIELHLGWTARFLKEPKNVEIPKLNELLGIKIGKKKLNEIVADSQEIEVSGKIIEIQRGNLHYLSCQKCSKKVDGVSGENAECQNCGKVKAEIRLVIGVEIEDETAKARVVAFGKEAEKLIGIEKKKLEEKLEKESSEIILDELKNKIVGKKIIVHGRAKENSFSGETEIVANEIELVREVVENGAV